jgi:hypothetical protein
MGIGGGGKRPNAARYFSFFLNPASAEGTVKPEIKAKTKIISANFFHIKDPSFRMSLSFFYFFRRRGWEIYSIRNGK